MSKRGNSIGHTPPNKMIEAQPMIPWERVDEFYPDDLDNTEVEDNNDMKQNINHLRTNTSQPSYHLNFQKRLNFFKFFKSVILQQA